jgi:4-hydroxy-3-methylbut-2-en-1-yl diphosphate synthase IspG/GcpE
MPAPSSVRIHGQHRARRGRRARDRVAGARRSGIHRAIVGDFHYNGHLLLAEYPECARRSTSTASTPATSAVGEQHDDNFRRMIEVAVAHGKPVRIGVNWGSLDRAHADALMDENARRTSRSRTATWCSRRCARARCARRRWRSVRASRTTASSCRPRSATCATS